MMRAQFMLFFTCLNPQALQSHSAQQQVLLHQLRNRLQDYE